MVPGPSLVVLGLAGVVPQLPDRDVPQPEDGQRVVLLHLVAAVREQAVAREVPGHL